MVSSPIFLKHKRLLYRKEGLTLIELLVVLAILALLIILVIAAFKPHTQLAKSRDARRKADLVKLKNLLEDFYNDNNCYPESLEDLVSDYIDKVPTDPLGGAYEYWGDCNSYRIYATLEFEKDPEIAAVGCEYGCGPGGDTGSCAYNYGVCSSNVGLEGCTGEGGGCSIWHGCSLGRCNVVTEDFAGTKYCNDPCCGGNCCGPGGCPWECTP